MVKAVLLLVSAVAFASAKPQFARDLRLHERRDSAPHGFALTSPAADEAPLRLRLALTPNDIQGLQDRLLDVSTPGSAVYGNHLSKEEVGAYVTPKTETVAAVNAWLSENGLNGTTVSPYGDWIAIQTTVGQANELFATQFSEFTYEETGEKSIRTLQYSIPAVLKGHLELVHPTITFPPPKRGQLPVASHPVDFRHRHHSTTTSQSSTRSSSQSSSVSSSGSATSSSTSPPASTSIPSAPASCDTAITPTCVQELYGIPSTLATESSNQIAVSGFIGQYANQADLKTFLTTFRKDLPSTNTFTLQTLDGGSNPQSSSQAGEEADLDVQYTVGLASGVPTVFISVGDNFQDGDLEGFLDIVNSLLSEDSTPQVFTTSYGQDENTISAALASKLCNAYAQLGARGTSVLFASGDGGVSGSQSQSCTNFVPTFPSGCPFLTSVGATQNVNPEIAADFSAGGFSNYFSTPSWQTDAKAAYLAQLGNTNSGKFNTSGRAYPDVSALGTDVEIIYQGKARGVDGTSCASPIFASVVALVNDRLIAAGKSPLGFLNPFLYSTGASAFKDITSGSNPGCNTNGFPAAKGWDPVTGLGTPIFDAFLSAVGL
ncbi:subtilisin-like protein [Gloeopeniophorella convolvens]|nr:subtilisin-like protein [Gloeopeniophorella convolvens]